MPSCIFACRTPVDESGDACPQCAPLIDDACRCGWCGSEWPIRLVAGRPTCLGCMNVFHSRDVQGEEAAQ